MDTSLSEEIAEKSLSAKSTAETETGDQTEQDDPKLPAKAEHRAERIKSSVARLTSSSINELEGLTSELNALQEFLKSETVKSKALWQALESSSRQFRRGKAFPPL
jgi:hypothetical protein